MLKFTKGGKIVMTESDSGDLHLTEDAGDWGGTFEDGSGEGSGPVTNPWDYTTADKLMKAVVANPGDGMALDAYLVAMGGWRQSPKTKLKYPHHSVSGGQLKLHKDGLAKAARSLMKKESNNVDAIDHAKRHFKEAGMNWKEEVEDKLDLQEDYEA